MTPAGIDFIHLLRPLYTEEHFAGPQGYGGFYRIGVPAGSRNMKILGVLARIASLRCLSAGFGRLY